MFKTMMTEIFEEIRSDNFQNFMKIINHRSINQYTSRSRKHKNNIKTSDKEKVLKGKRARGSVTYR